MRQLEYCKNKEMKSSTLLKGYDQYALWTDKKTTKTSLFKATKQYILFQTYICHVLSLLHLLTLKCAQKFKAVSMTDLCDSIIHSDIHHHIYEVFHSRQQVSLYFKIFIQVWGKSDEFCILSSSTLTKKQHYVELPVELRIRCQNLTAVISPSSDSSIIPSLWTH